MIRLAIKNLSLIFLLFCVSELHAQNYVISGYVREASSGEALIGATVVNTENPSIGQAANVLWVLFI